MFFNKIMDGWIRKILMMILRWDFIRNDKKENLFMFYLGRLKFW